MANYSDVLRAKKRRKRRKQLIAGLVILSAVLSAILIYSNREKIFYDIKQIGTKYSNLSVDTDGTFLLTVSGGVDYHAEFVNNQLFVLCDKNLYLYNMSGELLDNRQHAYSNAIMKTNQKKALLYSFSGTHFRVDSPKKMIYENQTEQPILFAVLGENDYVAVVTESKTYACRLIVFDPAGKAIYTRDCVERLNDICFTENGCVFSTIGAENGKLVTVLQSVSFDNSGLQWTSEPLPTLCMQIYAMGNGDVFVIGDTRTAYYNQSGVMTATFEYTGTLLDYSFQGNQGAVLLKNEERRQSVLMLFPDKGSPPASVTFDHICKNVYLQDETVYLLDTGKIKGYAFSGTQLSELSVEDAYDKLLKNGKYFYLMGYDRIQRVDISS